MVLNTSRNPENLSQFGSQKLEPFRARQGRALKEHKKCNNVFKSDCFLRPIKNLLANLWIGSTTNCSAKRIFLHNIFCLHNYIFFIDFSALFKCISHTLFPAAVVVKLQFVLQSYFCSSWIFDGFTAHSKPRNYERN